MLIHSMPRHATIGWNNPLFFNEPTNPGTSGIGSGVIVGSCRVPIHVRVRGLCGAN